MINKRLLQISAFVICFLLFSCMDKNETEAEDANIKNDAINQSLLEEVKKEPKVLDAFINDAKILYVSVKSDGTNRNGYASYMCELVRENKSDIEAVKVVEFGTMQSPDRDNAYGVLLGESYCNSYI